MRATRKVSVGISTRKRSVRATTSGPVITDIADSQSNRGVKPATPLRVQLRHTVDSAAMDPSATGVLIPVKAFRDAKVRLTAALAPAQRSALARSMATGVVAAAGDLAVWVVCDDPEVADWASSVGASVLWMPERGLNRAVTEGVAALAAAGVTRAVVCHADLPHATTLNHVTGETGGDPDVILVPDRQRKGTNVVSLPTASGFRFAYGPGSFDRHVAEAARLTLSVTIVEDPSLAWDVDVPGDLPNAIIPNGVEPSSPDAAVEPHGTGTP